MTIVEAETVCSDEARPHRDRVLTQVYREHNVRLTRYFVRKGHRDACDLVQEVFLRLSRCDPALILAFPVPMAYRLARFVHVEAMRMRSAQGRLGVGVDLDEAAQQGRGDLLDEGPSAETLVLWRDQIRLAIRCVELLPTNGARVIFLSRFHELTNREIAERQGITLSGVEKHLRRCVPLFERAINDTGAIKTA